MLHIVNGAGEEHQCDEGPGLRDDSRHHVEQRCQHSVIHPRIICLLIEGGQPAD